MAGLMLVLHGFVIFGCIELGICAPALLAAHYHERPNRCRSILAQRLHWVFFERMVGPDGYLLRTGCLRMTTVLMIAFANGLTLVLCTIFGG